ncbi:MAG TPA: ATP synthase F1 subunit epsilon [Planctomycetes bacterium]|nr:ATP synthase F1 subunit epsilon [Planctomycetota bacterium]
MVASVQATNQPTNGPRDLPKDLLYVKITTPDRVVFEGKARSLQFPTEDGLVGILPGHASMITTVDVGLLKMKLPDGKLTYFVLTRGFGEVRHHFGNGTEVRLTVDSGENPEIVDLERAQRAAERARRRLAEKDIKIDQPRAEYALKRALIRLQAKKIQM